MSHSPSSPSSKISHNHLKTLPNNPISSQMQAEVLISAEEEIVSDKVTHLLSILSTQADTMLSSPIETTTLKSTELTTPPDKATQSSPQLRSTESTYTLPLSISSINSDLCLSITSDVCNNGTNIDSIPVYSECDADGIWTVIQK